MTTTAACYNIVYIIGTNSFICELQREDARVTVHIVFSVRQVEHRQEVPHSSVRSDSYALGPRLWSTPHSVSSLWTCPTPLCNPFNSSAWPTASALRPSGRLGSGPRLPRGRSEPPSDQPCRSPSAVATTKCISLSFTERNVTVGCLRGNISPPIWWQEHEKSLFV